MSEIKRSNGTGMMLAAVAGATVGAGVALLLAPCSGKETRNRLSHRTREFAEKTTAAYEQGKAAIRQTAKQIGTAAGDITRAHDGPIDGKHGVPRIRT